MPPRKRTATGDVKEQNPTLSFAVIANPTMRVTRAAVHRAGKIALLDEEVEAAVADGGEDGAEAPSKKQGRKPNKGVKKVSSSNNDGATKESGGIEGKLVVKKAKRVAEEDSEVGGGRKGKPMAEEEEVLHGDKDSSKTVIIEHCKQCNSFKTRAFQVKDGLEKGVPGITVLVNPEKPRRGCFEIREDGGDKFISLLDMKRPFKLMKDLNMEQVVADIVNRLEM
ncbi:hypothetical protein Droror1_Dr00017725 [Drosera rotundifolia]